MLDVAYVPDLAFKLFKHGVGFMVEEESFSHVTDAAQQVGLLYLPHATVITVIILLCWYNSFSCPS